MNELGLSFGPQRRLSGTLTLPPDRAPARTGVLLLNVGIIHRIGPHRFNTKLARALAREGWATLRVDLSGQGDSGVPNEPLPFEQQAVADLQAAMDHFQRVCPIERFVIAGICSGACCGLVAALADPRVAGLWMLDGYAYPTARTRWNRYLQPLFEASPRTLGSWARKLGKRTVRAFRAAVSQSTTQEVWDFARRAPSQDAFGRDIQALVDRGVAVCFVYSGNMRWHFNYRHQLRDAFSAFDFVDRVRCEYLPTADHTATTLATQQQLIRGLAEWLRSTRASDGEGVGLTAGSPRPSRCSPTPPG